MRTTIKDLRATLRQRRHPPEFRIRSSAWSPDALAALESFAEIFERLPEPEPSEIRPSVTDLRAIADMVTNLWRLRRRLTTSAEGASRMAQRHLDATWDALEATGIKVQDHTGDPYHPGMAVKASFQPSPVVVREQVIDTVRPTLYLNDEVIQQGEVIVGTPQDRAAVDRSTARGEV